MRDVLSLLLILLSLTGQSHDVLSPNSADFYFFSSPNLTEYLVLPDVVFETVFCDMIFTANFFK